MKSDTITPFGLFSLPVRYTVPLFQRPYVWTEKDRWQPLWDDLRVVAELHLEAQDSGYGQKSPAVVPHFMGAIVLDQQLIPTGFVLERHVIDGQQRLTTLQLLMAAALEVVTEHGEPVDANALRTLTRNDESIVPSPDHVFKVWPTNYDRDAFRATMSGAASADLASGRIQEAYRYFLGEVREWAEVSGDPDKARSRLNALTRTLSQNLKVVVIDLEPGDNAQVIFETLNFRGTPLLAADLIKNSIFRQAEAEGLDVDELYEKAWRRFDSLEWRREVRQGRMKRPRIDVFLNYWLAMRRTHEVPADRIFSDFKEHVTIDGGSLVEVVDNLAHHADVFDGLESYPPTSPEGTFSYRILTVMEQFVWGPFLLWLFGWSEADLPPKQRQSALAAVESWAVRRLVCRLTSKQVNRMVIDLLGRLVQDGPSKAGDTVEGFLAERSGENTLWPSDDMVRASVIGERLYRTISRSRLRMVLEAIEDMLRGPKAEEQNCPRGKLTIEHVMPQGWREHWHLPSSAEPVEIVAARRDVIVQTIGNLTLVNNILNPALSNRPWTDSEASAHGLEQKGKRSVLNDHSLLYLNKKIVDGWPTAWDEESIALRGEQMADAIIRIWPGPGHTTQLESS